MDQPEAPGGLRRVEMHFALDDEAIVLDLVDDDDADTADALVGALGAADVTEAQHQLQDLEPPGEVRRIIPR